MDSFIKKYSKALAGFIVAFVSSLIALVNTGAELGAKTSLLALGTALVTSYGVYQSPPNQESTK